VGAEDFYRAIWHFVGIVVVAAPMFALETWVEERLVIAWRVYLTDLLLAAFFRDGAYYHLVHMSAVDNPDQRITQVRRWFAAHSEIPSTYLRTHSYGNVTMTDTSDGP
jgi:ABC-type uncharacterized transport system fused permease/ATPase subunit